MTTTIKFFVCTIEWFDDGLETTVIMTETDNIRTQVIDDDRPNDGSDDMSLIEQLLEENDFPDFRVISWEKYSREETFENN